MSLNWLRNSPKFNNDNNTKLRPTERPPLVGEVRANVLWIEGVAWSAQWIPTAIFCIIRQINHSYTNIIGDVKCAIAQMLDNNTQYWHSIPVRDAPAK
jgi:hypothetical protein